MKVVVLLRSAPTPVNTVVDCSVVVRESIPTGNGGRPFFEIGLGVLLRIVLAIGQGPQK